MLIVACVEVGNYLGMGALYVQRLREMVTRHLLTPHRFVCLSDEPRRHGMTLDEDEIHEVPRDSGGWWAKRYLFTPSRFAPGDRVLYLDLDSVIVGDLRPLAAAPGIIHLAQWGWTKNDYGSGVMVWDAGEHEEIWGLWNHTVPQRFRGDQDWMTYLGGWPALPAGLCVSYRYVSTASPPPGARVVCFHGKPKPHEVTAGWVPRQWTGHGLG